MIHRRTKIVALVGLCIFACSLIILVGFYFVIGEHRTFIEEKTVEREVAKARKSALEDLKRTIEETAGERAELASHIMTEEGVIDFLSLIEEAGRAQGATLTTESLTVEPETDAFEKLVIQLSAEGSYDSVMRVIALLEQLPYQSSLSEVLVSSTEDVEGALWVAGITLTVTKLKNL